MRRALAQVLPRLSGAGCIGAHGARVAPAACQLLGVRAFADEANLLKTPLYDFHVEHGGKMVPFAGWSMPIQYKDSLVEATLHCRSNGSLFDVSHMCGLTLKGKDTIKFLEGLVVGDIQGVKDGMGTLSVFTNEQGGIIDDTVITKVSPSEVYLVVNAGCREKDLAHIGKHLDKFEGDVEMTVHDDRSLIALQGPAAVETLGPLTDLDLDNFFFSQFAKPNIAGIPYTGEDGFEISVPGERAVELAKKLLENPRVRLCGLGARDSLRLEAGLCLYGNDLNEEITPVEAGLTWTIGKRRREACDFLGGDVIKKQLADGVSVRRVGLVSGGAPARAHSEITTPEGEKVGEISSGAFSPCLKKNVAMGYVKKSFGKAGTPLKVVVRGRANEATVTKMPFVPNTYFKAPTAAS